MGYDRLYGVIGGETTSRYRDLARDDSDSSGVCVPDRGYDLSRDLMLRATLVRLGESQHALVLTLLRFADELVSTDQFSLPSNTSIKKAELGMAKTLVENLAAKWQPEKYTDEYRENLMRIIKAKSKGKTVTLEAAEEPRHAEVVDLMERLRQSLANRGSAGKSSGRQTASAAKARVSKKPAASKSRKRSAA